MTLTPAYAERLHAILVEALSIMDAAPYVPADLPPFPPPSSFGDEAPAEPKPNRIPKPGKQARELDAEVYDALLTDPQPRSAATVAAMVNEPQSSVARSLRRLVACGKAKNIGSKRGSRYLPLSITGAVVTDATACEPDCDDVF